MATNIAIKSGNIDIITCINSKFRCCKRGNLNIHDKIIGWYFIICEQTDYNELKFAKINIV